MQIGVSRGLPHAPMNAPAKINCTMDILPLPFRTLSFLGFWIDDSHTFVILRRCWGLLIKTSIFYFTLTELIELYRLRNNVEELIAVMFVVITYILLCLKIINFSLRSSGSLSDLLRHFREKMCQPTSPDEEAILKFYLEKAMNIFKIILSLSQATGILFSVLPFVTLKPEDYVLPYRTYQFYDDTTTLGFTVTYAFQSFTAFFAIFVNVSMDLIIYGFIILATGQFELVGHRIVRSVDEGDVALTKQCIIHHIHVYETVAKVQSVFITVIAPLFFFSLLTLCASIFQVSQNKILSLEFLGLAMYLSCMLFQVYLYCWYGNELKLKSEDIVNDVYRSNWMALDRNQKKMLQFMMQSAQRGFTISLSGQCPLSLSTFVQIMKASYSAFNLLQQASAE